MPNSESFFKSLAILPSIKSIKAAEYIKTHDHQIELYEFSETKLKIESNPKSKAIDVNKLGIIERYW